jgi:hypothetical protein
LSPPGASVNVLASQPYSISNLFDSAAALLRTSFQICDFSISGEFRFAGGGVCEKNPAKSQSIHFEERQK